MTTTNVAARLGLLIDKAHNLGTSRMTVPALDVWASALGLNAADHHEVFTALAALHRNIQQLKQQMEIANPRLYSDCADEIDLLTEAFNLYRLENPWSNTRRLVGDKLRLSLKAFSAALEGRFDEQDLETRQIEAADKLLADFARLVLVEGLPHHVQSFLVRSIDQLRIALRRAKILGPEEFLTFADHLVSSLGRAMIRGQDQPSAIRRTARALGVTVASISAAVTLGLGVIALDQQTLDLLPWGAQVDPGIVRCVVEPTDHPQVEASIERFGEAKGELA